MNLRSVIAEVGSYFKVDYLKVKPISLVLKMFGDFLRVIVVVILIINLIFKKAGNWFYLIYECIQT